MGFFSKLINILGDDGGDQDMSLFKFYRNMGQDYLLNTIINNKDTTPNMKTVAILAIANKDKELGVQLYEKHKDYAKPIVEHWARQRQMYTHPSYNCFVDSIKKWEKAHGGVDLHVF